MHTSALPWQRLVLSKNPSARSSYYLQSGFTLIEILVVIALMALVTVSLLPNISGTLRISLEGATRDLATTIRSAFDEATLKGRVCRVAFDLDKNQYWVEQGPTQVLMLTESQKEEETRLDRRRTDEERTAKKGPVFSLAKDVTRSKISLPTGVSFTDILTTQGKEPLQAGMAYAHIFPHGYIEKLTIHIKDKNSHETSIFINPVSGRSQVFNSYIKETKR